MGDRTYCTLLIGGKIEANALPALTEALELECSAHPGGETVREALVADGFFTFDEVNGGELPQDLERALNEAGAAYVWNWNAGGGYGPGVTLYDPATGARGEYGTLDGELALRVADMENPDVIRAAERWLAFQRDFPALDVIGAGEGAA